ncbi:MAG: toll/interleukin-1 receptor domain-containing protein [Chitinophagaceae bacterium]
MSDLPFKDRPYQLFVSYSHEDTAVVVQIADWLINAAGLDVFRDSYHLKAGAGIVTRLSREIQRSKGGLIVISKSSLNSGWVEKEYNLMEEQTVSHPEYKIIPIRLDDSEMPGFIKTTVWVDVRNGVVDRDCIFSILSAIYHNDSVPVNNSRDIYVSRSWRPSEAEQTNKVCLQFIKAGFRLIGDSTDNKIFDTDKRIRSIMQSCGAVLVIAPDRGGHTSPFIEQEAELAQTLGINYLIIAADTVKINDRLMFGAINQSWYRISEFLNNKSLAEDVVEDFRSAYKTPVIPHFSFLATSLLNQQDTSLMMKDLVEQVTDVPCILGNELAGEHAQQEIIKRISNALFMIADISDGNYNTLIEAGIARGAGTKLFLVCQGTPRPNRFMFRDLEVKYYENDLQLLGYIHRFARMYRRRILNHEEAFKGIRIY